MTVMTLIPDAAIATEPCDTDCVYIDGRCWCYYGETTSSEFDDPYLANLTPPF